MPKHTITVDVVIDDEIDYPRAEERVRNVLEIGAEEVLIHGDFNWTFRTPEPVKAAPVEITVRTYELKPDDRVVDSSLRIVRVFAKSTSMYEIRFMDEDGGESRASVSATALWDIVR